MGVWSSRNAFYPRPRVRGRAEQRRFCAGWSTRLINDGPIDAPVKLRLVASGQIPRLSRVIQSLNVWIRQGGWRSSARHVDWCSLSRLLVRRRFMESYGAGGSLVYQARGDVGHKCLKRTNEISAPVIYGRKKSASGSHAARGRRRCGSR